MIVKGSLHLAHLKHENCYITTQPANIGPQDVRKMSLSNVPRTSPKDPIWPSRGRPNWRPRNVLKWRPGDVLIWRSRDVPGRLTRDVHRTFSGRHLEELESTQAWMSKSFFQNLFDWTNVKAFQHSRCIDNPVKLLRWSIFCEIS